MSEFNLSTSKKAFNFFKNLQKNKFFKISLIIFALLVLGLSLFFSLKLRQMKLEQRRSADLDLKMRDPSYQRIIAICRC